jgi:very-short-patch-repair endonuclease
MKGKSCLTRLISFASDKCESPLETMGWIILYKAQFVMPTQQFKITGRNRFKVFADMYWEVKSRRIILELDGRGKYTNYKSEKDKNDAYFEEKVREDKLREMGYEFIRAIPKEVHNGELLRKLSVKNIPKRRNFGLLFP